MNEYRNEPLYKWLLNFFTNANIVFKENIVYMLSEEGYDIFKQAFTSKSVNKVYNYENLEVIGDSILSNSLVTYMFKKFPQEASNVTVSQAKSYLGSKYYLSQLADRIGLSEFIISTVELREDISTKEDVMESFLGAIYVNFERFAGEFEAAVVSKAACNYIFDKYIFNSSKPLSAYSFKDIISVLNEIIKPPYRIVYRTNKVTSDFDVEEKIYTTIEFGYIKSGKLVNKISLTDVNGIAKDKATSKLMAAQDFYDKYVKDKDSLEKIMNKVRV